MKKFFTYTALLLLLIVIAYNIWASMGRAADAAVSSHTTPAINYQAFGADSGKGNVIGLQPYLTTADYSSAKAFKHALLPYFEQLKKEHRLTDKSVVLLPEYIGTWLVAANEKEAVYNTPVMTDAMTTLVTSNIGKFAAGYYNAPAADKTKYALFGMKGSDMCRHYEAIFSSLAKEFNCIIVAGSIALPDAFINSEGHLETTAKGKIYNTSAVFGSDGKIIPPLVKKIFPIDTEQGFSACGKTEQSPLFKTAAGNMALLICADSWFPEAYSPIAGKADFVVIPSLGSTDSVWTAPWGGYNGYKAPADVDTTLYHHISEGDAWARYSMGKRAPQSGIHNGMNVFFTGHLWDMEAEGRVLVLSRDSLTILPPPAKGEGRIVNLFLQ